MNDDATKGSGFIYVGGEWRPKTEPLPVRSESTGSKRIVSEETFRSTPMVNQDDDMVRVTIDMKRTCWWGWKRQMFKQPNEKDHLRETNEGE